MSAALDPFGGFDLHAAIAGRAAACGIELTPDAVESLERHARDVLRRNAVLHLTSITNPAEFVERHLGESFEGAARIEASAGGTLVDLGSGNGYPGLPLAAARPGLRPVLVEASLRKAEFLAQVVEESFPGGTVLGGQVQRASELAGIGPVRVLVARAVGGWERILPRLHECLTADGEILLWAGAGVDQVAARAAWKRLRLADRHPLPGRDHSWIWRFVPKCEGDSTTA